MPELPDIEVYLDALRRHVVGRELRSIRIASPFLLRSVDPPPTAAEGRAVTGARRLGKRVVLALEGELFLVIHLMIAGRLRWREPGAKLPGRRGLAAFDLDHGTLLLTEEGTRKRASLHVIAGEEALAAHDPGGLDVRACSAAQFRERLAERNHTVKRALTDPRILDGIGNAYSDEILHRARLSPLKRTAQLSDDERARLLDAARAVLAGWTARLRAEVGDGFPEKVTAFREGMAVHGRYRQPCPDCGAPVQRIARAENDVCYCPRCQTAGKILADRALSRLLKDDWPRTLEELERLRRPAP